MRLAKFVVIGCVLATGACAENKFIGRPGLPLVQQQALPAPAATDLVSPPRPQVLGPFDQLSVDVLNVAEASRTVTIDRSGHISLPLAGDIEASGQTPSQLRQIITDRLRANFVRNPQVTVNVTQVVSQVVTVDGQVRNPGLYPVTGRMTLMRAIARAEGATDGARQDFVLVYRRVEGRDVVGLYDLRAIRLGMYEDPEIFANDVVFVDESRARRVFGLAIQSTAILAAPLITLLTR